MLHFYWSLSYDLQDSSPNTEGFSMTNFGYIKRLYLLYSSYTSIHPQAEGELFSIPRLVKSKDNILAQYSLESSSQPIGVSEYELSKLYPFEFKSSLPSIEDIEKNLKDDE